MFALLMVALLATSANAQTAPNRWTRSTSTWSSTTSKTNPFWISSLRTSLLPTSARRYDSPICGLSPEHPGHSTWSRWSSIVSTLRERRMLRHRRENSEDDSGKWIRIFRARRWRAPHAVSSIHLRPSRTRESHRPRDGKNRADQRRWCRPAGEEPDFRCADWNRFLEQR